MKFDQPAGVDLFNVQLFGVILDTPIYPKIRLHLCMFPGSLGCLQLIIDVTDVSFEKLLDNFPVGFLSNLSSEKQNEKKPRFLQKIKSQKKEELNKTFFVAAIKVD